MIGFMRFMLRLPLPLALGWCLGSSGLPGYYRIACIPALILNMALLVWTHHNIRKAPHA